MQGNKQTRLMSYARNEIRALKTTMKDEEREALMDVLANGIVPNNIYKAITGHHNSERSLKLIRMCAPILYPAQAIEALEVSVETWNKKILVLEFGNESEDMMRLFWSPLEVLFMRATVNELLGVIAYLAGETGSLIGFDPTYWDFTPVLEIREKIVA